jgi:ATP-binding cassette subfamily F protein 3
MLQVRDLCLGIGDRQILNGIDWVINRGKRIALIGPNGVGKTTLLRILVGETQADAGHIQKPKNYQIGYLPQEELVITDGTVIDEAKKGRDDILNLEEKIRTVQNQLNQSPDNQESLLRKLGNLQHQFDAEGGWRLEGEAKKILSGLGFSADRYDQPMSQLSGGWKMRVYLARLLLRKPDLLLLDEPTNHLDLPSLEWLEQYLLTFPNSMVMVSHDRFFIDRLAHEIVELENGKLTLYAGNYHFYEKEKAVLRAQQEDRREQQLKEKRRQEVFINRFRAKNTKATQVQSRIKQLEKMEIIDVLPASVRLDFNIPLETTSFKHVLHMEDVVFGYGRVPVLKGCSLDVFRGEKIALVGVNGAGKTTLTRLITGQLVPDEGSLVLGERTRIGYYAQHQIEDLDLEATIYDEVSAGVSEKNISRIRDVLGIFQIRGDDVFKKIKVLSGGEKARVSLTKILLSPVNFLIMDEPTNHLDSMSKEALEKALSKYQGTVLLISHDRYFLDKITHKVILLKDGGIDMYHGNYSYYLEKREDGSENGMSSDSGETAKKLGDAKKDRKEQRRIEARIRQELSQERNRLKTLVEELEGQIEKIEIEKKEIHKQMADPDTYHNGPLVVDLQKRMSILETRLNETLKRWESSQNQLDKILSQLRI